jgi:hypothetical protein
MTLPWYFADSETATDGPQPPFTISKPDSPASSSVGPFVRHPCVRSHGHRPGWSGFSFAQHQLKENPAGRAGGISRWCALKAGLRGWGPPRLMMLAAEVHRVLIWVALVFFCLLLIDSDIRHEQPGGHPFLEMSDHMRLFRGIEQPRIFDDPKHWRQRSPGSARCSGEDAGR